MELFTATSCSLQTLIQSCHSSSLKSRFKHMFSRSDDRSSSDGIVWECIADVPVSLPTLMTLLQGQLVVIGKSGHDQTLTTTVCVYHQRNDSWLYISKVPTTRSKSLAAPLRGDKLIVVGGYLHSASRFCDIVELATILEGVTD